MVLDAVIFDFIRNVGMRNKKLIVGNKFEQFQIFGHAVHHCTCVNRAKGVQKIKTAFKRAFQNRTTEFAGIIRHIIRSDIHRPGVGRPHSYGNAVIDI